MHIGGVWNKSVYSAPIPQELTNNPQFNTTHFEMVNVLVALQLWGAKLAHQKVLSKSDNMALVNICQSGYTKDMYLATIIKNI